MDHHAFAQLLGSYGEFFGAIGVVVTLIYLAIQIRHNTNSVQANAQHALSEAFNRINLILAENPELAEIMSKGNADLSNLDDLDEKYRIGYENYNAAFLRCYEEAYSFYRRGFLTETYWNTRADMLQVYVSLPGVHDWWTGTGIAGPHRHPRSASFHPEFVRLVDGLTT